MRRVDLLLTTTKFHIPSVPPWLVSRPRLLSRLDDGATRTLTVVSAPAGAGKTTLLSSWIRTGRTPGPVVWLSVDRDDNDPSRFWGHVLTGVRATLNGRDGLPAHLTAPGRMPAASLVRLLINGIDRISGPLVLAFDDVHELTDPTTLAGLEYLARHAPPQLRLILATRGDLPFPMEKLYLAGAATIIRPDDLAFTRTEAIDLFAGTLPESAVEALWTRTEGWAAGMRMAALSVRRSADPAAFVAAFSGTDRTVAGYLIDEVLANEPTGMREFLLRTSVVDHLTADLADALTDGGDGARRLAELEKTNGFVVPLDSHQTRYRYHHLFAELLRAELERHHPHEVADLHRRAAVWYAANGSIVDAIRHAKQAADWTLARDLLVDHWTTLSADSAIVRELLAGLPPDLPRRDPELALIAALDRLEHDEPDAAQTYLRMVRASADAAPRNRRFRIAAGVTQLHLYRARVRGDLAEIQVVARSLLAQAHASDASDEWPLGSEDLVAVALSNLGTAALWSGDVDGAASYLEDGLAAAGRVVTAGVGTLPRINSLSHLALVELARGPLRHAVRLAREATAVADRHGWSHTMQTTGAHLTLAVASYQRSDLAAAGRYLDLATQATHDRISEFAIALVRAHVLGSQGHPELGLDLLREGTSDRAGGRGWRPPLILTDLASLIEARLYTALGRLPAAREALSDLQSAKRLPCESAVASAWLHLAAGDPATANTTVTPVLDGHLATPVHPFTLTEAWLVDAIARAELGDDATASTSLERALREAAPERYTQVFVDGGASVPALLARQMELGTEHASFVAKLQGIVEAHPSPGQRQPAVLSEPLTTRELTVLRHLPSRLSIQEIAQELHVSVNTVKSQVRSIYRKLGASGRRDAVVRAKRLGLL